MFLVIVLAPGIRMLPMSKSSVAREETAFAESPSSLQTSRPGVRDQLLRRRDDPTIICRTLPIPV